MSEKEKSLKRHELCCLRISDGTATERDLATLERKGIDVEPWMNLQQLLKTHFVPISSPDLTHRICSQLDLQFLDIGSALKDSSVETSHINILDVVSKRLELDFSLPQTNSGGISNIHFEEVLPSNQPIHQEELEQEQNQNEDQTLQTADIVDPHVSSLEETENPYMDSFLPLEEEIQEEIQEEELEQEEQEENFIDSVIIPTSEEELEQEEIEQEEIEQEQNQNEDQTLQTADIVDPHVSSLEETENPYMDSFLPLEEEIQEEIQEENPLEHVEDMYQEKLLIDAEESLEEKIAEFEESTVKNNLESEEIIGVAQPSKMILEDISEEEKQAATTTKINSSFEEKIEFYKEELNDEEIASLDMLEQEFHIREYLLDDLVGEVDFTSLIMSEVEEEFRKIIGSYDIAEDSLEQLIEDSYKSMTNPPPIKRESLKEPIKPLFEDILKESNFTDVEKKQDQNQFFGEVDQEDGYLEIEGLEGNSGVELDNIIDFSSRFTTGGKENLFVDESNVFPSNSEIEIQSDNDIVKPVFGVEFVATDDLEDNVSDEDFDSEESEEFMLDLDQAIQIEAIEEREIRDIEAIFEGSRVDIGTALRDPNPPSHSEMTKSIMDQISRFGSIQQELKLVSSDVEETINPMTIVSYEEEFEGEIITSITDIRPPVTINVDSNSGNKTMLVFSGLIAIAAILLLSIVADVPTGQEDIPVDSFELAQTDVNILDIDSDENFSIIKRDGEPTIIFIHEE